MVELASGGAAATRTVGRGSGRPHPKTIGFVGKGEITDYEQACLFYIGRCLALMGHSLLTVPAPGSETALRGGVEREGGTVSHVPTGVLDIADRTLLYPDPHLTSRLSSAYPDIGTRDDVVFISEAELDHWVDAMKSILRDYGINRP